MLAPLDSFFSNISSSLVPFFSNIPDKYSSFKSPITIVLPFSLYAVVRHSFSFLKQNIIFLLLMVNE